MTKENKIFVDSSIEAYLEAKRQADRKVMLRVLASLRHFGYTEIITNLTLGYYEKGN